MIKLLAHTDGWESPILPGHNLFIDEDETVRFHVVTNRPVVLSASAIAGDTLLSVEPLKDALASTDIIRFGEVLASLTAAADAGDTSIAVAALAGTINKGSIGYEVVDITGWTAAFIIRETLYNTTALLTVAQTLTTPTQGVLDFTIADTDTATFKRKKNYYDMRRTNAGSETMLAYGACYLR